MPPAASISGIKDNHSRGSVGDFLRRHLKPGADLDLVTAYFTVFAYDKLRIELNQLGRIRLLFGEAAFIKNVDPERKDGATYVLKDDGLTLSNGLSQRHFAQACANWMRDKVEVRSVSFVGLQTSADDVYILQLVQDCGDSLVCYSKSLDREVELESGILHPIVSGTDVKGFSPLPSRQFILFPYRVQDSRATLIPFSTIKTQHKLTADYLTKNRARLEERENGKFADAEWYRFGRSQNLGIQETHKLCVPRLVDHLHAGIDLEGISKPCGSSRARSELRTPSEIRHLLP